MKECIFACFHQVQEECILRLKGLLRWQRERTGVAAALLDVGDVLLAPGVSVMAA